MTRRGRQSESAQRVSNATIWVFCLALIKVYTSKLIFSMAIISSLKHRDRNTKVVRKGRYTTFQPIGS